MAEAGPERLEAVPEATIPQNQPASAATLAWVAEHTSGAGILATEVLTGGRSHSNYAITLDQPGGRRALRHAGAAPHLLAGPATEPGDRRFNAVARTTRGGRAGRASHPGAMAGHSSISAVSRPARSTAPASVHPIRTVGTRVHRGGGRAAARSRGLHSPRLPLGQYPVAAWTARGCR